MKAPALFGLAASVFVLSATGAPGAEWPSKSVRIMPKEIVERVNRETIRALDRPEVRKNFEGDGIEIRATTPAELTRFVQSQVNQWTPIIKATIKAE